MNSGVFPRNSSRWMIIAVCFWSQMEPRSIMTSTSNFFHHKHCLWWQKLRDNGSENVQIALVSPWDYKAGVLSSCFMAKSYSLKHKRPNHSHSVLSLLVFVYILRLSILLKCIFKFIAANGVSHQRPSTQCHNIVQLCTNWASRPFNPQFSMLKFSSLQTELQSQSSHNCHYYNSTRYQLHPKSRFAGDVVLRVDWLIFADVKCRAEQLTSSQFFHNRIVARATFYTHWKLALKSGLHVKFCALRLTSWSMCLIKKNNWRECRGQTTANNKQITCCLECHEFITYTRMTIATCKIARVNTTCNNQNQW